LGGDVAAAGVVEAIEGGVCASRKLKLWSDPVTSDGCKGKDGKGIGWEDGWMGFDIAQIRVGDITIL
jgi:hypothetical protein